VEFLPQEGLKLFTIGFGVQAVGKVKGIRDIERQINGNKVGIYASAPGFPHGIFDPVEELGQLALQYSLNLHVDACLRRVLNTLCRSCRV